MLFKFKPECSLLVLHLQICCIHLDLIEHHNICSWKSHVACDRLVNERSDVLVECSFCCRSCNNEYVQSFLLKVTLVDVSGKIFAWCTGQTAAELLQISANEFVALPEVKILFTIKMKFLITKHAAKSIGRF